MSSNVEAALVKAAFVRAGVFKDGYLPFEDLEALLVDLSPKEWSLEKLDTLFQKVDIDDYGRLKLEAFIDWCFKPRDRSFKGETAVKASLFKSTSSLCNLPGRHELVLRLGPHGDCQLKWCCSMPDSGGHTTIHFLRGAYRLKGDIALCRWRSCVEKTYKHDQDEEHRQATESRLASTNLLRACRRIDLSRAATAGWWRDEAASNYSNAEQLLEFEPSRHALAPALVSHLPLPDFAIWPAAGNLASKDLAKLARVSKTLLASVFHEAFLPELLRERLEALGISAGLTTLAHLHLAEEVALRQQLHIVFEECSSDVPEEAEQGLQSLADLVEMHPESIVEVEGHTMNGPQFMAELVSRARAEAVAELLQRFGLSRQQLKVSWFGKDRLHPDYPSQYHPEHRRVEVFLSLHSARFRV